MEKSDKKISLNSEGDKNKPKNANGESDISGNKNFNNEMEVHHHTHQGHSKKNWKDYFWEFLMLFLAVFCGFLAEYQLEHVIEKDRAGELAKNLYEELRSDSVNAQFRIQNRIRQEKSLKYLIGYFRDSSLTSYSKTFQLNFQYGINIRTFSLFEPKTSILDQLRNSGSLRYFKSDELQELVGDLSIAIKNINDRQALETAARLAYLNPILVENQDFEFWDRLTKGTSVPFDVAMKEYEAGDEVYPFQLRGANKIDREKIVGELAFTLYNVLSSTRQVHIRRYVELNAKILSALRNDYHLN